MSIPEHVPWRATGRTLGSGGQGQVELVTRKDSPQGQKFALKVLKYAAGLQARKRFQREIEAAKSISHPSIVRIIDHSEADHDFQYYVMEYHEGATDLEKIIFSDFNPYYGEAEASLGLFEKIVEAIGGYEGSGRGSVHRDISPKNILVLPDDTIRLIDFGICQIQDVERITLTDENVGARNYTSPECEFGEETDVGIHSDIYSAAKVLWSTITSKRAFAREEPVFGTQSLEKIFPSNREIWHLSGIFERSIRRLPQDRWRNTRRVRQEIEEIRTIIRMGFPPLQEVGKRCLCCGSKRVFVFLPGEGPLRVHHEDYENVVCERCGYSYIRNKRVLNDSLQGVEGLN